MKKILIINYEFPPLGGGGGRVSLSLARGFRDRGYGVDVLTSRYRGLSAQEDVEGVAVYRVPVLGRTAKQTATFLSMLSFLVAGFFGGARLCLRNRYSFINTHFVLPTGPLGFCLSKLFRVPNILSLHGGDLYDPSKKNSPHKSKFFVGVIRFLLNNADHVVATANEGKKNALNFYNTDKPIHIIPIIYEQFPAKKQTRTQLSLRDDRFYLVGIGRLVARKGFDYLIKSLELLDDSVELLLIGNGPEKSYLQDIICDLNLEGRVHLLGEISEERKFQYLLCADLYVLSSLHEGFGIVLQEAMQAGLPIVATNHGGQVDIVKEGINGLLVEPASSEQLAGAVERLSQDRNLYAIMVQNNLAALKNFGTEVIIDRYLALLEEKA